jgi:UDP-N-acetylglucosamine--N-acetylmuramyl-(pentapeptide) pyrophosphoryl-undecaprenol N-acetylglucosamine transferase
MRIVISGGGSGGHIYPALSVATLLRDQYDAEVLYLGSDDGLETRIVPQAGFRFEAIKAGKLRRYLSWSTVKGVARVPLGVAQAISIVKRFRPQVAFTSGGYVAVPTGLAARINGVPLLMHQQDVPPNLSNRILTPMTTVVSVSFADSLRYFPPQKTELLGNPLRKEILAVRDLSQEQALQELGLRPDLPLLVVTGGSQGARHLNMVIARALPKLLPDWQILQISGEKLFTETQKVADEVLGGLNEDLRGRYRLVAYLSEEMPAALQAASLIFCRSGASTLSELAYLGKPAFLVPLPPGFGGSPQEVNATTFEKAGAALVVQDSRLQEEDVVRQLTQLLQEPERLTRMAEVMRTFTRPTATSDIAARLLQMAGEKADLTQKTVNVQ